ncbi:unnamed protein product [Calypogeia fissa]
MFGLGSRRCWGLEEVVLPPPSFPVTTARALHDLLICETGTVKESLARGYKRPHQDLPKPPQLLSKFSLQATFLPPPRKPQYIGGSRSTNVLGKESLVAKSPSKMLGGSIFFAGAQSKGTAHGSRRSPSESMFQLKGLKTQGTRADIIEQLEQYRLNSEARMQLKQRSENYLMEKHERHLSKQGL